MFDWDPEKARLNLAKHGVSFEQAVAVFKDKWAVTIWDPKHSEHEYREITVGSTADEIILMVSHTDRDGTIRIISARRANARERKRYEIRRRRNAR
jgi:uncharacterized DUF497 family protein